MDAPQAAKQATLFPKILIAGVLTLILAFGVGINTTGAEQAYASDTTLTTSALTKFNPKINKKSAKIIYDKTLTLKATDTNGKAAKWTSSNKKIAKVSSNGKVTPVTAGKATITAKVGSKKLACKVTIVGKLNATKVSMIASQSKKLKLSGAKAKSWKSSNARCVAVSKNGTLTSGSKVGTATITCTDTKGNKYKCKVTVKRQTLESYVKSHPDEWAQVQNNTKSLSGDMLTANLTVKDNTIKTVITFTKTYSADAVANAKAYFKSQKSTLIQQTQSSIKGLEETTGIKGITWYIQYNNGDGTNIFSIKINSKTAA